MDKQMQVIIEQINRRLSILEYKTTQIQTLLTALTVRVTALEAVVNSTGSTTA